MKKTQNIFTKVLYKILIYYLILWVFILFYLENNTTVIQNILLGVLCLGLISGFIKNCYKLCKLYINDN